jgi:hypothetical protein
MTLTVRLDATLEAALESHCLATGTAKSLVVRESLAHYLLAHKAPAALPTKGGKGGKGASGQPPEPSANFRAFAEAGLIGAAELGGQSADKATVRARAMQRIRRSQAAPPTGTPKT